jgi:TRAP-type C4-dicarboxylate transport system substrate-binding protein
MKKLVQISFVLMIALGLMAGTALAKTYKLQFAGIFAPDHPMTLSMKRIAKEVAEKTDGKVKIKVFPANQLGDGIQLYEDVMRGNIPMAMLYITGQYDPVLEICSLPYLATSYDKLGKIFTPGSNYYKIFAEGHHKLGVKLLGIYVDNFISVASTKEIKDPTNPKADHGVKIRIPASELYKITMADLGFNTATINFSDLYTAVQTGVVDGAIGQTALTNYLQFRDIIKYYYPMRTFVETVSYLINEKAFEGMPEEYQKIIKEACAKNAQASFANAKAEEETYQKKLAEEAGVKIYQVSDEQIQEMAKYVRATCWPKFEKVFGKEVLDAIKKDTE